MQGTSHIFKMPLLLMLIRFCMLFLLVMWGLYLMLSLHVWSILEHNSTIWSPYLKKDITLIESVQKNFSQVICVWCNTLFASYDDRQRTHGLRPRTQKNPRLRPRTAPPEAKDMNAQGQEPRTLVQVFSKYTKRSSKFFHLISKKKEVGNLKKRKTKKVLANFSEISGVVEQNFNGSKNSAVLELRTGQFLRTWGFKAKDSKMCPRGQGRPWWLHFCCSSSQTKP